MKLRCFLRCPTAWPGTIVQGPKVLWSTARSRRSRPTVLGLTAPPERRTARRCTRCGWKESLRTRYGDQPLLNKNAGSPRSDSPHLNQNNLNQIIFVQPVNRRCCLHYGNNTHEDEICCTKTVPKSANGLNRCSESPATAAKSDALPPAAKSGPFLPPSAPKNREHHVGGCLPKRTQSPPASPVAKPLRAGLV